MEEKEIYIEWAKRYDLPPDSYEHFRNCLEFQLYLLHVRTEELKRALYESMSETLKRIKF